MGSEVITTLTIIAIYLLCVLLLGAYSFRFAKQTMEDYHLASRQFNTLILFCAIFGTNISAVALIGGPGKAYHLGWAVWPYFVTSWGWLTPLLFYVIGNRAWKICKKFGLMTQSDMLFKRFENRPLCILTTSVLMFYTIPYIMVGVIGGGRTFAGLTNGAVPYWMGALIVTAIVCFYVILGGMRGTAWTNTFQTFVFLIGGLVMFLIVAYSLGGPAAATKAVVDKYPALMDRSKFPMALFFSYGIIVSLAVPMFPQVFIRLLTGNNPSQLRKATMIYPLAAIFIWFIMAYIGMWGNLSFPGLEGATSDRILPMLLSKYAPIWVTGILGAAIFAALMSSLDAQLLTLGTMFIKDFLLLGIPHESSELEHKHLIWSRLVILAFAIIAFIAALVKPTGIIKIIEWSFAGYASIIIPVLGVLYWKRCTAAGCIVSIVVSQIVLVGIPIGVIPSSIAFGMLPGIPAIVLGLIAMVAVSYITKLPKKAEVQEFFSCFS